MSRFTLFFSPFFFSFFKGHKSQNEQKKPTKLCSGRYAQVYICVLILLYMCPHTTMYVPLCYCMCFLILPYSTTRSSRSSGRFFSSSFFLVCEQAKAEVHEIQKEFQQEREDLLETVREQVCTVVQHALLLHYFTTAVVKHLCSYTEDLLETVRELVCSTIWQYEETYIVVCGNIYSSVRTHT